MTKRLTGCDTITYEDKFCTIQRRQGSLDAFVKGDDFSRSIHPWLDWNIMEIRELSMCEKVKTHKYTLLSAVSIKVMKKSMFSLEVVVQLSVYTWLGEKILFYFVTFENEANMSADAIIDRRGDVLDMMDLRQPGYATKFVTMRQ